ncbi:MAG TPA: long-chain fatty acid--CoA ligase [Myxococcales bacterium]|jgi:fatty-acyl-CoA synthase
MDGLMMQMPLTLAMLFRRVERYFPNVEVVTRNADKSISRTTYGEVLRRSRKLANALVRLGVKPGDRVATLAWNSARHLETYFAIPMAGAVLHTLNPRLSAADLTYIVNHAEDRVVFVDEPLVPVFDKFRAEVKAQAIVLGKESDALIERESDQFQMAALSEENAAGLCYTSGTTGRPKGVLYSHRSTMLHALISALPDAIDLGMRDVVLPVVPMFHVNAWGLPYTCAMLGAKLVLPGPHLDPHSLLQLMHDEKVTCAGGVPTVWLAILEAVDKEPKRYDLSSVKQMVIGGSAAPQAMIEAFDKRHGLKVLHAWGMTEMSPIGSTTRLKPEHDKLPESEQYKIKALQGLPPPLVEARAMSQDGEAPWDGKSMGELEVRGPWVARSYYKNEGESDKFRSDGWFRTGDVVTIDPSGYIRITDRSKDLIKSGGEWISSVDLENALMGHPSVKEAAVVAVPHPKWTERPVACVVTREGATATDEELKEFLRKGFAEWQLPDAFVRVDAIPRTAAGKFLKSALREKLKDFKLPA